MMKLATSALLLMLPLATQAELRAPLQASEMTNGQQTLSPLQSLKEQISPHTAILLNAKGQPVATATWVGKEGYFITKASEVPRLETCTLRCKTTPQAKIREIRRDVGHDLVLAQAIGVKDMTPAEFTPADKITYGQWVTAPTLGQDLKIGVISAQRRDIKGFGAAIGIRMDDRGTASSKGVRITGVAEDSPAATAGLRADDVMLELAGESVQEYRKVNEIISKRQPGEEIEVKFKRAGKENSLHVRLASRTKILANWDGEDFANGGISIRTDNFTQVLQHDLPLSPLDMGSPLLDLEGHIIGINIARVDRVTTFALPSEIFWPMVQEWLKADRNPPKAVPVKATVKDMQPNKKFQ